MVYFNHSPRETTTFVEQKAINEETRAIRYSFGELQIRKNPNVRFGYTLTLYYSNDDFERIEFSNDILPPMYAYMLMSGIDEAAIQALQMYRINVRNHLRDLCKCFEENDINQIN